MAEQASLVMPQTEPPPATLQGSPRHFISPEAFARRRRNRAAQQGELSGTAGGDAGQEQENDGVSKGSTSMPPPPPKAFRPPMGESGKLIHNLPPRKGSSKGNIVDYLV
jgi:hypothetical protein